MKKRLTAKDLITVGIMVVLTMVAFMISGILGNIPILMPLIPFFLGILGDLPFLIVSTKVGKFGAISIMGILLGLIGFLMGQHWILLLSGCVCGILADLIIKSGEYKSSNKLAIGYGVFTEWSVGSMLPMWIMKDVYFSKYEQIAPEYVKAVRPLTENYMLIVVVALGFVGALIGYFIGKKLLNKHFKRAGIV